LGIAELLEGMDVPPVRVLDIVEDVKGVHYSDVDWEEKCTRQGLPAVSGFASPAPSPSVYGSVRWFSLAANESSGVQ
jgi:hypothetical protein